MIRAYDPEGMKEAEVYFKNSIQFCTSAEETMIDAEGIVVLTEWKEFRQLGLDDLKLSESVKFICDMRNILDRFRFKALGVDYTSIGH